MVLLSEQFRDQGSLSGETSLKSLNTLLCIIGMASSTVAQTTPAPSPRTVADSEIGSIFTTPNGMSWSDLGAYVGAPTSINFSMMSPESVKVVHGRFQHFKSSDDQTWAWFPYREFRAYEANEVNAGRAPLFITATYQGKRRPVLWNWSLGLNGNVPTTPPSEWRYAVNVGDERFIRFWVNRYARPVLWKSVSALQNLWIGLDECAFNPNLYGVLDDNNHFVSGVTWDTPFPQNDSEYLDNLKTFFRSVKTLAPDIKVMANLGSMKTWDQFPALFSNIDGVMAEEIFNASDLSTYLRGNWYSTWSLLAWAGANGKVTVLRSQLDPTNAVSVRTSYVAYLLIKGSNSFFAPSIKGTYTAVPPATFSSMRSALGSPVAPMSTQQEPGLPVGYRLYSRQYEGGIIYLNVTGKTQTITLPSDRKYYDAKGNIISTVTVPDAAGDYVLCVRGARSASPVIHTRTSAPASGPVTITITPGDSTPGATIYYTLDGTTPSKASRVMAYPNTIVLDSSATVRAMTALPTAWSSFSVRADYVVKAGMPTVQFVDTSGSGAADTYYPVIALDRTASSDITVPYTIDSPATRATGSVQIRAGSQYGYFRLPVAGQAGSAVVVRLLPPAGATLGANAQFTYTIEY